MTLTAGMASGDSSFYHYNHLGTTVALTNAAESVSDTYRHDAWGVQLASTGSTVNPHTYVGRQRYYRMPNAGLYHLGFRDYAQRAGRFTTVDPVDHTKMLLCSRTARSVPCGQAAHPMAYAYAAMMPTAAIDPTGLTLTPPEVGDRDNCLRAYRKTLAYAQHRWLPKCKQICESSAKDAEDYLKQACGHLLHGPPDPNIPLPSAYVQCIQLVEFMMGSGEGACKVGCWALYDLWEAGATLGLVDCLRRHGLWPCPVTPQDLIDLIAPVFGEPVALGSRAGR